MSETVTETEWHLVSQGAESKIWRGMYNEVRAIKKERFEKKYRVSSLDSRLTRERIRAELNAINKIRKNCPQLATKMPKILSVTERDIIMTEVCDAITVCQHLKQLGDTDVSSDTDSEHVLQMMGELIARIHTCGVIHGDLTTSNFMLNTANELIPIDFGLAFASTKDEDRAVDLYVLERALVSAHPNANFDVLLQSYAKNMVNKSNDILKKFDAVRLRGRKRSMIG